MDSRHESLKEGFANHVILAINTYITNNIDTLLLDKILRDEFAAICKRIYAYLGVDVDTDNILSNRNLLSKDIVLFPAVLDPEANKILNDAEFENLVATIKTIIAEKKQLSDHGVIEMQIDEIMHEYEL